MPLFYYDTKCATFCICATLLYFCTNLSKKATYFRLCCHHFDDTPQKMFKNAIIIIKTIIIIIIKTNILKFYQNICDQIFSRIDINDKKNE